MFKISSVLFLGASVWRVTTARVSEPDFEPVSVEPEVFVLTMPEVPGEFEGGMNLALHGVVFNEKTDLPGILIRTASWCDFRSEISEDYISITSGLGTEPDFEKCMGIFLSELFDWLRTANSPILSSSRSTYPRSVEEHNASVREARKFVNAVDVAKSGVLPSSSTISFEE